MTKKGNNKKQEKEQKDVFAPIIVPSSELKALVNQAREKLDVSSDIILPEMPTIGPSDLSIATLLDTKPSCRKALIKAEADKKWNELQTQIDNQIQKLPDTITNDLLVYTFKIIDELIDQLIRPADAYIVEILTTYNSLVRLYRKMQDLSKSKEEREKLTEKFTVTLLNIVSQYPYVADAIALYMLFDMMICLIRTLRDAKSASPDQYAETAAKMAAQQEILSQEFLLGSTVVTTILYILQLLRPLLITISAIYGTAHAYDAQYKEEAEAVIAENNSHIETPKTKAEYKSNIQEYAANNQFGFSYVKSENQKEDIDHEQLTGCDIDYTNLCNNDNYDVPISDSPIGAFIEINPTSRYSWEGLVDISYGDTIGNVAGWTIKSPVEGTDARTDGNVSVVMFANKSNDELVSEAQSLASTISGMYNVDIQGDMADLVSKFDKLNKTKTVIREYLLGTKLPFIPIDLCNTSKRKKSLDNLWKQFKEKVEDNLSEYQNEVQRITGKENVETTLNGAGMSVLKDQILQEESSFYNRVFDIFENYLETSNVYCDKESIGSYFLAAQYAQIVESIEYDENNEYIVRLCDMLSSFIFDRQQLEQLSKQEYINSLDELCDNVIRAKWNFDCTYMEKFDELFTNTNENGATDPIYKFLITLMDCAETQQETIDFTTIDDLSNIPEPANTDTESAALRAQLRTISRKYRLISALSDEVQENESDDRERLANLRIQTIKERDLLRGFYDEIKSDYIEFSSVLSPDAYDIFKQAVIVKKQNVYYNDKLYEHYFVTPGDETTDANVYTYDDPVNEELCESASSALSKGDPFTLAYWMLYCTQATLAHCALVQYWPTGIVIAGAPVNLPVVYIPIYHLKGNVSILFGLGVCGVFVYPMILFMNMNIDARSILQPINTIMDYVRSICNTLVQTANANVKKYAREKSISAMEERNNMIEEQEQIDIRILDLKERIGALGKARKDLNKLRKEERKKQKDNKNKKKEASES